MGKDSFQDSVILLADDDDAVTRENFTRFFICSLKTRPDGNSHITGIYKPSQSYVKHQNITRISINDNLGAADSHQGHCGHWKFPATVVDVFCVPSKKGEVDVFCLFCLKGYSRVQY